MTDRDLQQKRIVAALIDIGIAIAISLAFMIASLVLGVGMGSATDSSAVSSYVPRVLGFLGSLISLGYILGRDVVAGDRSIGKKIQDIRVVTTTGAPIDFMTSARRNGIFAIGVRARRAVRDLRPDPLPRGHGELHAHPAPDARRRGGGRRRHLRDPADHAAARRHPVRRQDRGHARHRSELPPAAPFPGDSSCGRSPSGYSGCRSAALPSTITSRAFCLSRSCHSYIAPTTPARRCHRVCGRAD